MRIDFLIVGQGLAGTLLAFELIGRGKEVMLIDREHQGASSTMAAGIMNPITGRRFVKSWMYDTLWPVAQSRYQLLEQKLDISLIRERPVLRLFGSQGQETDWLARSAWPGYEAYMKATPDPGAFAEVVDGSQRFGEVNHSFQVDLPGFIHAASKLWKQEGILQLDAFAYDELEWKHEISYRDIRAGAIIFCEGQAARMNPYFPSNMLSPSRGDVLWVRINDFRPEKMLKHKYFLVHLEEDIFWFGARNNWDVLDEPPRAADRIHLEKALRQMIQLDFQTVDHRAAVRPTVQDRRPIFGEHPLMSKVYIFNGLGTKGASLGPYWASKMADHLLMASSLPDEVSVSRFYSN